MRSQLQTLDVNSLQMSSAGVELLFQPKTPGILLLPPGGSELSLRRTVQLSDCRDNTDLHHIPDKNVDKMESNAQPRGMQPWTIFHVCVII